MIIKKNFLFLILITLFTTLSAQELHDFGFKRELNLPVYHHENSPLLNPWGGGMNSVRMSQIDLNLDGIKDLFIFEKNGNRILTFINQGNENEISYQYAPEYKHFFPSLHDWVILTDYNGDGKEDIFTYGLAGIKVYKNVSDTKLKFELITDQLTSYYYNGYVNIFASPDDYIAIEDIDNDGDLDILNFMVLGKHVHYQKNYAIENHGTTEVFDFHLEDECWGRFEEGEDDNSIILNSDCGQRDRDQTRHVGSTLLAYDYTGNGLKDLILGDIDYPGIVFLENGGTIDEANMVSMTMDFPNAVHPISLYSMPVVSLLDISNNGKPEIIASPSDPSLYKSENLNSVWLYVKNNETDEYELQTRAFLQEDMIDVGSSAYPVLYDWNGDGLEDLFIANYGSYDSSTFNNYYLTSYYTSSIAYYQNIGSDTTPSFLRITDDFGNLKSQGLQALHPAFGDFNGDGKIDILCGNQNGNLLFFANQANNGDLPIFDAPEPYQSINVGQFSTPQYFDIDKDGKNDLLIGNKRGQITYYRNIATDSIPIFELITNELGNVDVRDFNISYFGFSTPYFFRNSQDETVLFCGNEQGKIAYYKNIDGNLDGEFELIEPAMFEVEHENRYDIIEGGRIAVAVYDINNDGFMDMFVGNFAGGLSYFRGISAPDIHIGVASEEATPFLIFPNPADETINIAAEATSFKSLSVFSISGKKIEHFENIGLPFVLGTKDYPSGIYLIQIIDDNNWKSVKKVVVSH